MRELKPSVTSGLIAAVLVIGSIALPSSAAVGHAAPSPTTAAPASPTLPVPDPASPADGPAVPDDVSWGEGASATTAVQPLALGDPASIEMDDQGYTLWSYNYASSWCVPYSRIKYPFDLGTQDPRELGDATLRLTFAEANWAGTGGDPTWSVALNGDPGAWDGSGFLGDWNIIGSIAGTPTWHSQHIYVTQVITLPQTPQGELIDGTNNLWLQQHTFGDCPELPDCAMTCVRLSSVQLRAAVKLVVRGVSPPDKTEAVYFDQRTNSDIRVKFSTLPKEDSVNKDTFVVYTYDEDANRLYVPGKVTRISQVEYAFTPSEPLLEGVRYVAQVYGEEDADRDDRDAWVQDLSGEALQSGKRWTFSTIPHLQVSLKPVQILENTGSLLQGRSTVLRTFVRWDKQPGIHDRFQVKAVDILDVEVGIMPPSGSWQPYATWRGGARWLPAWSPAMARQKREYQVFTTAEESYLTGERRRMYDSFNYFGFNPSATGTYQFRAGVWVADYRGTAHRFAARASALVDPAKRLSVDMHPVAIGSDFGITGTVSMSAFVGQQMRAIRAVFPASYATGPASPAALSYVQPPSSGLCGALDYSTGPWQPYYKKISCLLDHLERLRMLSSSGCTLMVGVTPVAPTEWLPWLGTTRREVATHATLVGNRSTSDYRFVTVHEFSHLSGRDEHFEGVADYGFDVQARKPVGPFDLNPERDFMDPNPAGSTSWWLVQERYRELYGWLTSGCGTSGAEVSSDAVAPSAPSLLQPEADSLLLVSGAITRTTGEVTLMPWYEVEPRAYTLPDPGPYSLVFLDAAGQEIAGYAQSFDAPLGDFVPAGDVAAANPTIPAGDLSFFTFIARYPVTAAKAQIRQSGAGGTTVLWESVVAATPPTVTIDALAGMTLSGAQPIAWHATGGAYHSVQVSTDNGTTWTTLALDVNGTSTMLQTTSLPNTTQGLIRVAASDGLRSSSAIAGPFAIDNPPAARYTEPTDGETDVPVNSPISALFRDPMSSASLNAGTFTVSGGPFGTVTGEVTYDAETNQAVFTPNVPLAYATTYTARLTTGVKDSTGEALPTDLSWTFTTEADTAAPTPVALTPADGEVNAPTHTAIAVLWDRALNAATVNASTFQVTQADGAAVAGAIVYDAASHTATFTPDAALSPDTLYEVTLKAGIVGSAGYATEGDFIWGFTTGAATQRGPALTGSYADYGTDTNGNGTYNQLSIQVGVFITATGSYSLTGTLADTTGAEIDFAYTGATLTPGVHFLTLVFDGAAIGGRSLDGPYVLRDLLLSLNSDGVPTATDFEREAYRTAAYPASRFEAPLIFTGLPDVVILPGSTRLNAFNVRDYAHHEALSSNALTYTIELNSQTDVGLTLWDSGQVDLAPDPTWSGTARIAIGAGDGTHVVQDTFTVLVGWPKSVYLPLTLRLSRGSATSAVRDGWVTLLADDFENGLNWSRYSAISTPPYGPGGTYYWAIRDCAAYSGQYSAWPYGGGADGEILSCGAPYPNTLGSWLYLDTPFDLTYTSQGQVTAKVWTDLAPGAEVCLKVARGYGDSCSGDWGPSGDYYGVCRSGQTVGWQDLTLDLANVPELGSVLGTEHMCLAVTFYGGENGSGSRSAGAYIDDVQLRVCPEGLDAYCTP